MLNRAVIVRALLAGAFAAVLVSSVSAFLDWRRNPDGIFHDKRGTAWSVVFDTAVSWAWPVFGVVTLVAVPVFIWVERRK